MFFFFFFFFYVGCPGQLTRTTTIPHGPLDILQAQEQVRHRGGDRRAHRGSNPGQERNKSHDWPQQLDPHIVFSVWVGVIECPCAYLRLNSKITRSNLNAINTQPLHILYFTYPNIYIYSIWLTIYISFYKLNLNEKQLTSL